MKKLLQTLPLMALAAGTPVMGMDYESPDLCIRSLEEYKPGYYFLDMPSRYDPDPFTPYILEVDQETVDLLRNHDTFAVVMCPPGWPNDVGAE